MKGGAGPPAHSPSSPSGYIYGMVESETRNKRTSNVPSTKRTLRWIGHSRSFKVILFGDGRNPERCVETHLFCTRVRFGRSRSFRVIQGRWFWYQSKARIRLPISRSLWVPFLRYGDLLAKNCLFFFYIFATPLSFGALAPYVPFGISCWS